MRKEELPGWVSIRGLRCAGTSLNADRRLAVERDDLAAAMDIAVRMRVEKQRPEGIDAGAESVELSQRRRR